MSRCTRMPRSNAVPSNVLSVVNTGCSVRQVRPPSFDRFCNSCNRFGPSTLCGMNSTPRMSPSRSLR